MQPPIACRFSVQSWAAQSACLIQSTLSSVLQERGSCSVMLTGGRSAAKLYAEWVQLPDFRKLRDVTFYFGDERCVPPAEEDSNFGLAQKMLFGAGVPEGCRVLRMEAEAGDVDEAAVRYAACLPEVLDILLLGVGEDGHIASLFPRSSALREVSRKVVCVNDAPKAPAARMTVTPVVLRAARKTFVLALGKQAVFNRALAKADAVEEMPVRMLSGACWLLEKDGAG